LRDLFEEGGGELKDVAARLKKYNARLNELRTQLREAEGPAEPLWKVMLAGVESLLIDLPALLREDVASVAPIKQIVGR
jgi:hypothetical protein